ncbi:MAG: hypothetical protein M3O34_05315 [Chloroflexota bacterium]|nr:hypothetical protein [Chloroflexota bacterium]
MALVHAVVAALLPPLLLLLFTAGVFWTELAGGPIAYGRDTAVFYYPLTEWAADELRVGRLPAWLPLIFGGYPLLADGEIGVLSPVNAAFLLTLPMPLAYTAMRTAHFAIAALGLYALTRTLGASGLGACIGGLAFAYGSFMVGHLQHDNILRSATWLPWILLAAERALRAPGTGRTLWIAGGAIFLAFAALGVHIQPVLLTLVAVGAYVVAGPFGAGEDQHSVEPTFATVEGWEAGRSGAGIPRTRARGPAATLVPWIRARFWVGCGIVLLGLGLAGAQLLPLYELGQRSLRPSLVTYSFATSYAVAPLQILTLIFPLMFNFDWERHWTFWSPHETTLYAGVVPLVLALVGMAAVRRRAVGFFSILGLVSLVLAFGDYLPFKAYGVVWQLPGFNVLRAPARFSLLFELSLACLAALGATWVARRARLGGASRRLSRFLASLMLLPLGLALAIGVLRWWLHHDPVTATALVAGWIATSRENWQLGAWHVYYGLMEFSRPSNANTALGLMLLASTPLVLWAWLRRPRLEAVWSAVLLAATGFELWLFLAGFYPHARPEQLRPTLPAATYLEAQPQPFRVFVEPALNPQLGANLLARLDVATVNGYSSLEPPRFSDYWWSIVTQDNFLLDLFNVRYVVAPRQPAGQRTFEGATYHPADRLMSGTAGNLSGEEAFRVPPTTVSQLVTVAAVEGSGAIPAGTPVGEVTLFGRDGATLALPLRAGLELGEYLVPEPGYPMAGYDGPRVVWAGPVFTPNRAGPPGRLYGAIVSVEPPFQAVGVVVQSLVAPGRLHLHGLGLRAPDGGVHVVRPTDKAKYREVLSTSEWSLFENTMAWSRVSVVGGAIPAEPGDPISEQLQERSWDPRREVIVDGLDPADAHPAVDATPPGRAELLRHEPSRVVVRADMDAPGYLVLADRYDEGWRALVDEREAPVLRANGIERAVRLPAGSHVVTFVYDPVSFKVGLVVSAAASALLAATLLAVLLGPLLRRRAARPSARIETDVAPGATP